MSHYKQLTCKQRYQIYVLLQVQQTQNEIAKMVGIHTSTVSRELRRNRGRRGYRPKQAHRLALSRRNKTKKSITEDTWKQIEGLIRIEWSPEQISGRMTLQGDRRISHEWIYQHILRDKEHGGELYKHLRCQKKRRKRYGAYERRGNLPNRVWIDERPAEANQRARIGDWEADTIIGRRHQQAILTLVDRKSRFVLMGKLTTRSAEEVERQTVQLLSPWKNHTLTSDNGKEFACHTRVAQFLGIKFFFAHPFSSWQRGTNENTNGLIRQYFPKKTDFFHLSSDDLSFVIDRLNNRPKKCLDFKTPSEVFLFSNSCT
jgi:IS30 family transposase